MVKASSSLALKTGLYHLDPTTVAFLPTEKGFFLLHSFVKQREEQHVDETASENQINLLYKPSIGDLRSIFYCYLCLEHRRGRLSASEVVHYYTTVQLNKRFFDLQRFNLKHLEKWGSAFQNDFALLADLLENKARLIKLLYYTHFFTAYNIERHHHGLNLNLESSANHSDSDCCGQPPMCTEADLCDSNVLLDFDLKKLVAFETLLLDRPLSHTESSGTSSVTNDSDPANSRLSIQDLHDRTSRLASKSTKITSRIHSQCFTGDTTLSLKCDCRTQLHNALEVLEKLSYDEPHSENYYELLLGTPSSTHSDSNLLASMDRNKKTGPGLLVYMAGKAHEGRGIGLENKMKVYKAQDIFGYDTLAANRKLNFPDDARNYSVLAHVWTFYLDRLQANLGASSAELHVDLITNNPNKLRILQDSLRAAYCAGDLSEAVSPTVLINKVDSPNTNHSYFNYNYIDTKKRSMNHLGL